MALQRTVDKWKTKRWFTVYAPKAFKEAKVCEIPAAEDKQAVNRKIKVSLEQLTHNPQHSFTNVVIQITDVNGDAAHTKVVMIEQVYAYIRSLVRRYRSVASTVAKVSTKDNVSVVFKVLAVTRQRSTSSRLKGIRSEMQEFIKGYAKDNDYDSIVGTVVDGKFQSELAGRLAHITPLNKVEVRRLEVS
jgi:small subunit ribosomal protein S3Ae